MNLQFHMHLAGYFHGFCHLTLKLPHFFFCKGLVGIAGTFLSYSSVCAVSVVFIFFFVPETKDQSLEQVSAALKE